jgi:hypothetical protein
MMSSNITCKQAVDFISKKEERKLSPAQRFRLWKHLAACSLCRTFLAQNKVITHAFKQDEHAAASLSAAQKEEIIKSAFNNEIN